MRRVTVEKNHLSSSIGRIMPFVVDLAVFVHLRTGVRKNHEPRLHDVDRQTVPLRPVLLRAADNLIDAEREQFGELPAYPEADEAYAIDALLPLACYLPTCAGAIVLTLSSERSGD